jgi:ribosomal protein L7/L12
MPTLDLSNEMRNAIQVIKSLTEIVKYHNLHMVGGGYQEVIEKAEAITNLTDDLKIFLRYEVVKELKSMMKPLNHRGQNTPSNPFEHATAHYIASTIPAIRLYRAYTGLPLKEAKEAVDLIREDIYQMRIDALPQGMVK